MSRIASSEIRNLQSKISILPDGTYILDQPARLPETLDVLIVGGGPAGTAAAFRAKELGLAALVIDFDDLMKRIRDYAKDKLILPDYGGGDKMQFPKGGGLISALHFAPIDKDDMCRQWKNFYREFNVPAQVGVELMDLQPSGEVWRARVFNHNTKSEQTHLAKHVVIAVGRGVPRRFDIPGNTEGMAYRLADAALYVGEPALVIGGGTSAAEAVIAISHAKAKANDATAVYWSYRGDKLPKVSKALAESFFEAYMGNGNIRHYPYSEPAAMITTEDQKEHLSLRIDRRKISGRPGETSHLEFAKEACLACIGEDLPVAWLSTLGIEMATGGRDHKKRFCVTPLLETQQPNVYLIGDLLSPVYFETEDFNAGPASFQEIKRRGNIKAALRDGVLVAEAVAQKLAGKRVIRVDLDFQEEKEPAAARSKRAVATAIVESEGPPRASLEKARAPEEHEALLVRVLAGNVEEDEYPVQQNGLTTIGRRNCDLNFPDDSLLSEKHASISHGSEGYFLRDDASANGVFIRLKEAQPCEVQPGSILRLGKQFLVLEDEQTALVCKHFDQSGKLMNRVALEDRTIVLGRGASDVNLDSRDMTLSRRHIALSLKDGKIFVKDLGSANGSFLKIKSVALLEPGDEFRVGQQRFRFRIAKEAQRRTIVFNTKIKKLATPEEPASKPDAPSPGVKPRPASEASLQRDETGRAGREEKLEGMVVKFKHAGKICAFKSGQTICDVAEQNGVKIKADCHLGSCGMDPIRVLSGAENLNTIGDEEQGTLEDINKLEPGKYRLACMAKPKGPVVVEIVGD